MEINLFILCLCSAGNTTNRNYGSVGRPYIMIGRGIVYTAIYEIVAASCTACSSDYANRKTIRGGVNTIWLYKKVKERELRKQQIQVLASLDLDNCTAEFIASQPSEDEGGFCS